MKQEIIQIDLGAVNCYLGKQGNSFILFDTGGHTVMDKEFTDRRDLLVQELLKVGCSCETLKLIVLTHGDNDHVANASYIRKKFNSKIAMHADDVGLVEKPDLKDVMKSFNFKSIGFRIIFRIMKKKIEKVSQKILNSYEGFKPDTLLREGDSLSQFGFDAKIHHIPGHTLGSIAVQTEDRGLIVGDTLTNGKRPGAAPNALDFENLYKSVDRLRMLDVKVVYPGHGKIFAMTEYTK